MDILAMKKLHPRLIPLELVSKRERLTPKFYLGSQPFSQHFKSIACAAAIISYKSNIYVFMYNNLQTLHLHYILIIGTNIGIIPGNRGLDEIEYSMQEPIPVPSIHYIIYRVIPLPYTPP